MAQCKAEGWCSFAGWDVRRVPPAGARDRRQVRAVARRALDGAAAHGPVHPVVADQHDEVRRAVAHGRRQSADAREQNE